MSWAAAQADAEQMTAAILDRIAALRVQHGPPAAISRAIYPTPHDFRYLRPAEKWSWEHHTAVVRAVQRQLKRHGIKVRLVPCDAAGCAAWLNARGLLGTTENRAAYVAMLTAPPPS